MNPPSQVAGKGSMPSLWPRVVTAVAVLSLAISVVIVLGDRISLSELVQHEASFRQLQQDRPVLVYGVAFLIYVFVTGLSIPAATGLSLFYAWYFGFWRALVLVSFSSTAGATVAFLISRFILREWVQRKFAAQLSRFNAAWEREGAVYLLTLRLLPVVPFFIVNAVMGLTPIRVRTFWWASQLGMLPGTAVFVYAGSTAPDLRTLAEQGLQGLSGGKIALALTLLALLPIGARWLQSRLRSDPSK
jgi:uncharacterized membrane protein YdjX (TVP38/TMEM64 family)